MASIDTQSIISLVVAAMLAGILLPIGLSDLVDGAVEGSKQKEQNWLNEV